MGAPDVTVNGLVLRRQPVPFVEDRDDPRPMRIDRFGNQRAVISFPSAFADADEGSILTCMSPTVGTGLTWVAAQTGFSDTAPNFFIQNLENPKETAYQIELRYLKMIATAAATASLAVHYAAILDTVIRNLTTDNMQALSVANPNGNWGNQISSLVVKGQNNTTASVLPASSAGKRVVARGVLGGLNIVGDELFIAFGTQDVGAQSATTAVEAGGQPGRRVSCSGPVIVGPQQSLAIHIWMPSSSASFNPEVELGLRIS